MRPLLHVLIVDLPDPVWRKNKAVFIEQLKSLDPDDYFMLVTGSNCEYVFCEEPGESVAAIDNTVSSPTKYAGLVVPILEICEDSNLDLRCMHITDNEKVGAPYKIDEKIERYGLMGNWVVLKINDEDFTHRVSQWTAK